MITKATATVPDQPSLSGLGGTVRAGQSAVSAGYGSSVKVERTAVQGRPLDNQQVAPRAVDTEELQQAVEQLQSTANLANRSLQFKISTRNDRLQVMVMDRDTDEVIREIPPTEVLEMADKLQNAIGMLIDTVV